MASVCMEEERGEAHLYVCIHGTREKEPAVITLGKEEATGEEAEMGH